LPNYLKKNKMNIFEADYIVIQKEFIEYIAQMRAEIQRYAEKENKSDWYLKQQNEKLRTLLSFKKRYDRIFQNILLVINDSYETGKRAGKKEAQEIFDVLKNPYKDKIEANREAFRAAHETNIIEKWAHLY